jgi:hypothetical protein
VILATVDEAMSGFIFFGCLCYIHLTKPIVNISIF